MNGEKTQVDTESSKLCHRRQAIEACEAIEEAHTYTNRAIEALLEQCSVTLSYGSEEKRAGWREACIALQELWASKRRLEDAYEHYSRAVATATCIHKSTRPGRNMSCAAESQRSHDGQRLLRLFPRPPKALGQE